VSHIDGVERSEHRNQDETQKGRADGYHAGHSKIVFVRGIPSDIRPVHVVHGHGRHGVDESVDGGHEGRSEGRHDESEHPRRANRPCHLDEGGVWIQVRRQHPVSDHGPTQPPGI